jgi:orotidine-5'-phosphate decarboxylase
MNVPTYSARLQARIQSCGNPICFGMDPVPNKIPYSEGSVEERIYRYYMDLLEGMSHAGVFPAAVKPNTAYFEAISLEALAVLQKLIRASQDLGILVVLDAKRGDIGKSSSAYAQAAFGVFGADSVTVSPYMGGDSVRPFLDFSPSHGVYALLRTSNPGAKDLQDQVLEGGDAFYQQVAEKLMEWDNGSLGAVVGATHPAELERITQIFVTRQAEIPFLIPGVSVPGVSGQQGGTCQDVMRALRSGGATKDFHLLNSSSGLSFAYEAFPDLSPPQATVKALELLVRDCQ